jgi:hypothetical protein
MNYPRTITALGSPAQLGPVRFSMNRSQPDLERRISSIICITTGIIPAWNSPFRRKRRRPYTDHSAILPKLALDRQEIKMRQCNCARQRTLGQTGTGHACITHRDENGTEIFRIDRFRFLYYEPFFNIVGFNWFHNHFQPFLYSLIAKCRNMLNRPLSFFYIVSPFSTISDRFHP